MLLQGRKKNIKHCMRIKQVKKRKFKGNFKILAGKDLSGN